MEKESFKLKKVKMRAGKIIPPSAAIAGSATCVLEESSPSNTSRLTSSPTKKKKIAMSPSLTHKKSGFAMPNVPILI